MYNQIHEDVRQLETELSHYDEKSPISAINRNAGVKPVAVPRTVLSMLRRCRDHEEQTEGLFDVVARPPSDEKKRREDTVITVQTRKRESSIFAACLLLAFLVNAYTIATYRTS